MLGLLGVALILAVAAGRGGHLVEPRLGGALPSRMPESKGKSFFVNGRRGVDAGPGTIARPWRTINYALRRVPIEGSVIFVRAGTYIGMVHYARRGDPRNPVTLRPYAREHVRLIAPHNSVYDAVWIQTASAIRIRGFEITSPTSNIGVRVENSNDVEIVGCDIHATGRSGILVAGTGSKPPTGNRDIQIWDNRFHDNGGNARLENAGNKVGGHSVYWGAISSNTDGINQTTYGGVIANNLFYNQPYGYQLQIGSEADGLIVTNNTFYRATHPSPGGSAIVLYSETQSTQYVTRDVLIVNNIITRAANRGVYGSGGGGLMSTNVVRNNLAYGNVLGDFLSYFGSTADVLFELGPNRTGRKPLLVLPRELDFRLQARSPAIGVADREYAPPNDFAGNPRDATPDIGAFEYVSSQHRRQ
jgi:hypothetical protein